MEWSNELVREFLSLIKTEPIIWKIEDRRWKGRNPVYSAWLRIQNAFSVKLPIDDLKKKKKCLFTQYNVYVKKIKESVVAGSGPDDVYQPVWFAFDLMNSFLGDGAKPNAEVLEQSELLTERPSSRESAGSEECSGNAMHVTHEVRLPYEKHQENMTMCQKPNQYASTPVVKRRRGGLQELVAAKKQMNEAFSKLQEILIQSDNDKNDECEAFGHLLAQKLRKLEDGDRLRLMNEIDNLSFKYIMAIRERNRPSSAVSSPVGEDTAELGIIKEEFKEEQQYE